MTDDYPFYPPNYKPPPRQPRAAELLFEFVREADHAHFRCELLYHGPRVSSTMGSVHDSEALHCDRFGERVFLIPINSPDKTGTCQGMVWA